MSDFWKKNFNKLFGTQLENKHRLFNVIMCILVVVTCPVMVVTFFQGVGIFGVLLVAITLISAAMGLVIANRFQKPRLGASFVIIVVAFILYPAMYFADGGMMSGMPMWLTIGAEFIWLVLDGKLVYIFFGLDVCVFVALYLIEYLHPEFVNTGTSLGASLDSLAAVILTSLSIGLIFTNQHRQHEEQKRELEEHQQELNESMEALERANQAKARFLANMSHEVRTPINSILGMNEMILKESKDEAIASYAGAIDSAGQALLAIINDILDISRVESGSMELQKREYRTEDLLNDCFNLLNLKMKQKNLEYTVRNNPYLPTVLIGDDARLRQVILNLLTNAVKYTTVGNVTLSVDFLHIDDENINMKISVKDTGIGIKEEDMDKLFSRFERINLEENRDIEGAGIGLAIAKNLVELMGGSISVTSEYGVGSTFEVCVPQKVKDATPLGNMALQLNVKGADQKQEGSSFTASKARILSVDDVKMNHEVLKALLKDTKVMLDTVYSGREAINMLQATKYDLVLMDHMMPEMDGVEAFKIISTMDGINKDIPVIVITANAIAGAREEYLKIGFKEYLSKPVKGKSLEDVLLRFLPGNLIDREGDETNKVNSENIEKTDSEGEEMDGEISREIFEQLGYVDMDYALECCAESLELYVQAVIGYCGQDNRLEKLEETFAEKNWNDYRVSIHAVKSSSLLIGISDLSEKAKALEMAVKEENYGYVEENHAEVMKQYAKVIDDLQGIINKYGLN